MIKDTNPIQEMSIKVEFQDGRHFTLYSPESTHPKGKRKDIGWKIMTLGLIIMFGRKSNWTVTHNSEK